MLCQGCNAVRYTPWGIRYRPDLDMTLCDRCFGVYLCRECEARVAICGEDYCPTCKPTREETCKR